MNNVNSFLLMFLLVFCMQNVKSQTNEFDIETIVIGDINNDKIIDTAFVKCPKFIKEIDDWGDCKNDNCKISVSFSSGFPGIDIENAVFAKVENIGDIDKDGKSEIIIVPGWFIGCWGQIHFYSIKNGRWKAIGRVKRNICENESFKGFVKKMKGNKIQAVEQLWVDGDVVEKRKIIKVK